MKLQFESHFFFGCSVLSPGGWCTRKLPWPGLAALSAKCSEQGLTPLVMDGRANPRVLNTSHGGSLRTDMNMIWGPCSLDLASVPIVLDQLKSRTRLRCSGKKQHSRLRWFNHSGISGSKPAKKRVSTFLRLERPSFFLLVPGAGLGGATRVRWAAKFLGSLMIFLLEISTNHNQPDFASNIRFISGIDGLWKKMSNYGWRPLLNPLSPPLFGYSWSNEHGCLKLTKKGRFQVQ